MKDVVCSKVNFNYEGYLGVLELYRRLGGKNSREVFILNYDFVKYNIK